MVALGASPRAAGLGGRRGLINSHLNPRRAPAASGAELRPRDASDLQAPEYKDEGQRSESPRLHVRPETARG